MELSAVRARTPVDRSGLIDDIFAVVHHAVDERTLIEINSGSENQLAAWNRVYVQYQEGGALGLPTWTNPPRTMYHQVTTTDLPQITKWAEDAVNVALSRVVNGTGSTP